jgi:hypothetical protein
MISTLIFSLSLCAGGPPDRFIVLSEFQVWADAAGSQVFEELNRLYLARGRSHVFNLYPRYDYFVWEFPRMRRWIDEAADLGAFNVFCIGDDTRTALGHLFSPGGLNPKLKDVFFKTVSHAHEKGFLVAVEPVGLPEKKDGEHLVPWLRSWLGSGIPEKARADIIKLSIEWFGAYRNNPDLAGEVESFFLASREVNPHVLIYVDSIGGKWRKPQPFHRWLLGRFPGTIISHYLNTSQVEAFRHMGARNLMVQINPSETAEKGGQFFIFHDKTVAFLQDAVQKRIRYISLAGVNFGYSRYNYDLFLQVIRPHLKLARGVEELRKSILPDAIGETVTKSDVKRLLSGIPLNPAGRPAIFGETREDCTIQRLAAIGDGKIGPRFTGATTGPFRKEPVKATFGLDFGEIRKISQIRVVPCLQPDETTYIATDLRLEYRSGGRWQALPGGVIRGNRRPEIILEFSPLEAGAVRLVIESESDDGKGNYRACCQELAVK